MTKETFLNLPEEKRKKIIDTSLEEFSKYPYDKASLSRIVEKAGIAKGSMYQYFKNKKDLYKHVINLIIEKKKEILNKAQKNENVTTLVGFMKMSIKQSVMMCEKYPRMFMVNYWLDKSEGAFKKEILGEIYAAGDEYMKQFVQKAKDSGEIRQDLDTEIITRVLIRTFSSISDITNEFYIKEKKIDMIYEYTDTLIDVISNGILNKRE